MRRLIWSRNSGATSLGLPVVLAGGKILRTLGFAIAVAGSEMAEDGDAGQ
jgi:hypothetical protein